MFVSTRFSIVISRIFLFLIILFTIISRISLRISTITRITIIISFHNLIYLPLVLCPRFYFLILKIKKETLEIIGFVLEHKFDIILSFMIEYLISCVQKKGELFIMKKNKNVIQKYCDLRMKQIGSKSIYPTDKIVCYQWNQSPYETAYIFNKKYEALYLRLTRIYQKGSRMQKFTTEYKIQQKRALILMLAGLSIAAGVRISNTITPPPEEKAIEENEEETINTFVVSIPIKTAKNINKELEMKVQNEMYWTQNFKSIMVEEKENRTIYDCYLEEYCEYFNLDANKVIEFAKNITNGYQISFQNFIKTEYDFSNPAASCMIFMYHLNKNSLTKVEYSLNDFKLPEKITTVPHDSFEDLTLLNGEKCIPFLGYVCDCFGYEEKEIALSLIYAEAGKTGSPASNNRNNGSGIMDGDELKVYPRLEAWMIEHVGNLRNFYPTSKYNINDLETFSLKYNKGDLNERTQWKENINAFYNEISENYEELFQAEKEITLDLKLKP